MHHILVQEAEKTKTKARPGSIVDRALASQGSPATPASPATATRRPPDIDAVLQDLSIHDTNPRSQHPR